MLLKIGILLLVAPLLALLFGYFSELTTVNECAAAGGYYDYVNQLCNMEQKQPFISYFQRNPSWVNSGFIVSLIGLIVCFFGLYKGRS